MRASAQIRVRLLPSACDSGRQLQYANTFVLNDEIAIDAGSLGYNGTPETQSRVRHVLLTHCHADHIASLPFLLINDHAPGRDCIEVRGTEATLGALRAHVFNDVIWPDLERIGTPEAPFVRFVPFTAGEPFELAGLRFTAVPVDHTVPTVGFLIEAEGTSIVIGGDSAPTDELWERARRLEHLAGVFLETSFPERERALAEVSKHLTPSAFAAEARKLPAGTPMYAVHFKPNHHEEICAELEALGLPSLSIVEPGQEYAF